MGIIPLSKTSMMDNIKLVATDLDGTLLRDDKTISPEDLDMLVRLGRKNICRVVATGRNMEKVKEVIPEDVPFDYVAFSSGAGIYDCGEKRLLYSQNIPKDTVNRIIRVLIVKKLNFFVFRAVPMNYCCWFYRGESVCNEFERYYGSHYAFAEELPAIGRIDSDACQFLVIFKQADEFIELKEELEKGFGDIKILRASSPLQTGYVWMEIFHYKVSKGNAIRFLCEYLNIGHRATLGIGNDYNDLELLDFTSFSYLVKNGPEELKLRYLEAPSNEESAFSYCLKCHL